VPDKLTVYDNQLQGTVTSNYLANLVFLWFGTRIGFETVELSVRYSRYDITMSSDNFIDKGLQSLVARWSEWCRNGTCDRNGKTPNHECRRSDDCSWAECPIDLFRPWIVKTAHSIRSPCSQNWVTSRAGWE
jgi:hypothetical protein